MTVFAYARVSTKKQNLERQIEKLMRAYPEARLFSDKFTGTTTDRPNFNKMLKLVNEGDVIVFDEIVIRHIIFNENVRLFCSFSPLSSCFLDLFRPF